MDAKTDLKVAISEIQWFPKLPDSLLPRGGEKFSFARILDQINQTPFSKALLAPVNLLRYPGIFIALTAISLTNPLQLDYSQFDLWKSRPAETQYQSLMLPPAVELEKIKRISPPNFAPSIMEVTEETVPENLKAFAQNPEKVKNTLRWKNMMEQIVADKRLSIPPSQRAFWVSHMLKIIFIESGGDPEASSGIAFGLTQLKPSTANEMAREYQIPEYDIYQNAWDNSFLGTAYQLEMAGRFGPEIGAWAHHLGQGSMNQAIRTYLVSNLGLPVGLVDEVLEKEDLLLKYIKDYRITPEKLLNSPAVTGKLKAMGTWGDWTWEYPGRFQAAGIAMNLKTAA